MKLLRIGNSGKEKPAVLDNDGKFRDLSSIIKDLDSVNLNFKTLSKLHGLDLSSLRKQFEPCRLIQNQNSSIF